MDTNMNNKTNISSISDNKKTALFSLNNMLTAFLSTTFLFAAATSVLTQSASADESTTKQKATTAASNEVAAERLNKLLANTKSMTATFKQKTVGSKTLNGQFTGNMTVQRPNNLYWQTKDPSEQLIVANGLNMWVYDKDLEQATKQPISNQVGNTPALLLSGDYKKIAQNFDITQPHAKKNYYVLYPKGKNANFKNMSISYSGGKPVMMVLNDNLGQSTSIKFSKIKLNKKVPASKFLFTPPKGVDIISQ